MAAEGRPVTYDRFLDTFGRTNASFLHEWLGPDATQAELDRVSHEKEAAYRRLVTERGIVTLPGAMDWVRRLHEAGWRQAIASSAPRANVEAIQDTLGVRAYFAASVAAEDVLAGKPDPQVFLLAAERLEAPASRAIVVEDAVVGIEAANRAGMRSIGVRPDPEILAASLRARSLTELADGAFERLLAL